jgi:hypothetical protein
MTTILAAVLVAHGLIHLLGVAKAFGWAELPQLTRPVAPIAGAAWLVAALLFVATAISLFAWPRASSALGLCAVAISMLVIVPSWTDARAGAIVNVAVLAALAFRVLAQER